MGITINSYPLYTNLTAPNVYVNIRDLFANKASDEYSVSFTAFFWIDYESSLGADTQSPGFIKLESICASVSQIPKDIWDVSYALLKTKINNMEYVDNLS